jgi:hypothetical protein
MRVDTSRVELRALGEAGRAIARIQRETYTSVAQLNALARQSALPEDERLAYTHAPLLFDSDGQQSDRDDVILGLYYTLSHSSSGDATATTIRYYMLFSDENGGTPILTRMARYGHPFDRELVYRVTLFNDEVMAAYYQAPAHRQVRFSYDGAARPIFAIASANHNFRRVGHAEIDRDGDGRLLAFLPRPLTDDVYRDPDFLALAAREVQRQYAVDVSEYVYVTFFNPLYAGEVTLSVRVDRRWYNLHDAIPAGVITHGDRRIGIHLGFTPLPGDIEELRIITRTSGPVEVDVSAIFVYPSPQIDG